MTSTDSIQDLAILIRQTVESHRLAPGSYTRYLSHDVGENPYGCADAANLLYTVGSFPRDPEERRASVERLQAMQNPETGLFSEPTHHPIHTTAHCAAALELFDAAPLYPMTELKATLPEGKLEEFLDGLSWVNSPWNTSHKGAGIYVAMNLAGDADPDWNRRYFRWLWENADPETGLWRKGCTCLPESRPLFEHMAGTFHYLFNHEYAHMPLRYPEKMIDSCLEMYDSRKIGAAFGHNIGFIEIDWIFCLTRASAQTPHRYYEIRERLREFAGQYVDWLRSLDWSTHEGVNDLHALFGASCALAELQKVLRGELRTETPLRLVLDRRPFI